MTHEEALHQIYETATEKVALNDSDYGLSADMVKTVSALVENSEQRKIFMPA